MPRGRKEGSASGKRSIFWVCISTKDGLNVEKIYSPPDALEEEIKDFTENKASKIYQDLHGFAPDKIIGPCYDVKSLSKNSSIQELKNKKENSNLKNSSVSSILGSGIYNGWKGTILEIAGNPNEVIFIASERTDSNLNKILPAATPIKKELINFLME